MQKTLMSKPKHYPVGVTKVEDYIEGGEKYVVVPAQYEDLAKEFLALKLAW